MSSEKTLYLKGDRNVEVTKPEVTLGDILSLECSDKTIIPKVKAIRLLKIKENSRQQRFVISILEIIACIHEKYPSLEVQNLGEQDIIVTYEKQKTPGFLWHMIKTAAVVLITFFGAAFSIMAFNNDVDVTKLFGQIYELVTGNETDGFIPRVSLSVSSCFSIISGKNALPWTPHPWKCRCASMKMISRRPS